MQRTIHFLFIVLFLWYSCQVMADSWQAHINIKQGAEQFDRVFGGHANGSDGYDAGLDTLTPPPAQGFYAYFQIASFPTYLKADIRNWTTPFEQDIEWRLVLMNTMGDTTTLTWDPMQLPEKGLFYLQTLDKVDMRECDSVKVVGDCTVKITYKRYLEVYFAFPAKGWYLISLPVTPPDNRVCELFPNAVQCVAHDWDPMQQTYVSVTQIDPGKGYWLSISKADTAAIQGDPVKSYTRSLSRGWHLFGSVLNGADFTNPETEPIGAVASPVFGWTAPSGPYVSTSFLHQNSGYWAAVFENCQLTVSQQADSSIISIASAECLPQDFVNAFGNSPPLPPMSTAIETQNNIPKSTCLHHNFPNPFNPSTVIRFDLSCDQVVGVHVYNVRGEKIRTLIDAKRAAGTHHISWDGRDNNGRRVASGVYFIRMISNDYSATIKAMLMQ